MNVTANRLSLTEAGVCIRSGTLTSEELVRACLERAADQDRLIKAWSYLDPAHAIRQARERDKMPYGGPLHGIPIAIKDMIDTVDMPTQHNSNLFVAHRPNQDAACVATLRAAGAVIIGKTDTTEFAAAGRPAATRNPHDTTRTPGGSSSGSAAAVADYQVPAALGTQTGGSTIRPASFCGVYALKPTWGAVSPEGLKLYSSTLDTLGWFTRAVEDLDLLADVFAIHDDDPPRPVNVEGMRIGLCRSPVWDKAEPATRYALQAAADALKEAGALVTPIDLPSSFNRLDAMQTLVMYSEGRAAFLNLARTHGTALHDDFRKRVENRDGFTRRQLLEAYDQAARCRVEFDARAADFDAILTPSATGEAPVGTKPGDAVFNRMWTLLHVPCVNLPGHMGPNSMPVGVTLVSGRFTDRQLLMVAQAAATVVDRRCAS